MEQTLCKEAANRETSSSHPPAYAPSLPVSDLEITKQYTHNLDDTITGKKSNLYKMTFFPKQAETNHKI
jgi:hypothetical protein